MEEIAGSRESKPWTTVEIQSDSRADKVDKNKHRQRPIMEKRFKYQVEPSEPPEEGGNLAVEVQDRYSGLSAMDLLQQLEHSESDEANLKNSESVLTVITHVQRQGYNSSHGTTEWLKWYYMDHSSA